MHFLNKLFHYFNYNAKFYPKKLIFSNWLKTLWFPEYVIWLHILYVISYSLNKNLNHFKIYLTLLLSKKYYYWIKYLNFSLIFLKFFYLYNDLILHLIQFESTRLLREWFWSRKYMGLLGECGPMVKWLNDVQWWSGWMWSNVAPSCSTNKNTRIDTMVWCSKPHIKYQVC